MKRKKIMALIALSFASACIAFVLFGSRTDRERNYARLPLLHLSACKSSSHPRLPERFRAIYLMAPFTSGQLVIAEIVHDGLLSATRFTLYGVEHGVTDFLVKDDTTYLLSSAENDAPNCSTLGNTGWQALPADWLSSASKCTGSGPVLGTRTNWWSTPMEPLPSSYWIWSKHLDGSPFRLMFANPTDGLAAFGRFALSHQLAFESLDGTDLSDILSSCQSSHKNLMQGPSGLSETINKMMSSPIRANEAIARLVPALKHPCSAPTKPLWTNKLALTGMLTPFDAGRDPVPMEVIYDWSLPGQRSRLFPAEDGVAMHDYLLLEKGGYNVTYRSDKTVICAPGLPGTLRPDWAQRGPCECRAQIEAGTLLSPDEPIQILSCPLNMPRIAWAFYTLSGRPTIFMVTSKLGDEGLRAFAVLDYNQWALQQPIPRTDFIKPPQCPDSPIAPAGMPTTPDTCITCHSR